MAQTGSIPKRLIYIDRPAREYKREFDDGSEISKPVIASSSFVSDAENEKTIDTGISWASVQSWYENEDGDNRIYLTEEEVKNYPDRYGIYFDQVEGKWWKRKAWVRRDNPVTYYPKTEETDNVPLKNVQILSLEKRSEGGRAYKVLIGNRVFDLREDVLLDVLLNAKVENGLIDAEFIWCRVGSQMKLVRVGSELHKQMEESVKLTAELSTPKELVYGGIYRTKTKTLLYLGKHRSVSAEETRMGYTGRYNSRGEIEYNIIEEKPLHVFYEVSRDTDLELLKLGNFNGVKYFYFNFQKSKPKSVFEGTIDLPPIDEFIKFPMNDYIEDRIADEKKGYYQPYNPKFLPQAFTIGLDRAGMEKLRDEIVAKVRKK